MNVTQLSLETNEASVEALKRLRAGQRAAAAVKSLLDGQAGPSHAQATEVARFESDFDRAIETYKRLMRERERRPGRGIE